MSPYAHQPLKWVEIYPSLSTYFLLTTPFSILPTLLPQGHPSWHTVVPATSLSGIHVLTQADSLPVGECCNSNQKVLSVNTFGQAYFCHFKKKKGQRISFPGSGTWSIIGNVRSAPSWEWMGHLQGWSQVCFWVSLEFCALYSEHHLSSVLRMVVPKELYENLSVPETVLCLHRPGYTHWIAVVVNPAEAL